MCGRAFQLALQKKAEREDRLRLDEEVRQRLAQDRYNIAPSQALFTVHQEGDHWGGTFRSWGVKRSTGQLLINSRSDTMQGKPGYFDSFKRVLIPVSGFYEWPVLNAKKRAFAIRPVDHEEHWWFAGLMKAQEGVEGFTIMTVDATAGMAEIHDRWPLILKPEDLSRWLDPATPRGDLFNLMTACPDDWVDAYEVGPAVGNVRNDGPGLIEPLGTKPRIDA